MKKSLPLLSTVFAAFALAKPTAYSSSTPGTAFAIGQYDRETVHVASGTSAVGGNLMAAEDGRLVKTGSGTATMDKESLVSPNPPNIDVLDGSFTIGSNGTAPAAAEPTAILATASLWLAADEAKAQFKTSPSGDNTAVDVWRDVRDTDASATNYPYAATPLDAGFVSPLLASDSAGNRCLYFKGFGSKCTMLLHKSDGTTYAGAGAKLSVCTVFAVTRVVNYWGHLLGNYAGDHVYHTGDPAYHNGTTASSYYCNWRNPQMRTMRFFDNGESRDTNKDLVRTGLRVLEWCHSASAKGGIDSLFGQARTANREGGDYLMELVVFDAALTESQRLAVEGYLAAKWGIATAAANLRVASGATATVAAGGLTARLSGNGDVEAAASGATFAADGASGVFGGALRIGSGVSARIYGPGVPLALEAGDSLDVARGDNTTAWGRETATLARTATAGTVEKTGAGTARIASLPTGVGKLDVRAGRVILAAPVADAVPSAGGGGIRATIPNPGFESSDMSGWTLNGGDSTGRFRWTSSAWQCPFAAPEGDWVLCLKRGGSDAAGKPSAETTAEIPVSGRYELTFQGSGRNRYGLGTFHVRFSSGSTVLECDETDCFMVWTGYRKHRVLTPVLSEGTWTMRIEPNFEIGDATATLDDVQMTLVTENTAADGAWRIPNGGFEELDRLTADNETYTGLDNGNCSLNYPELIASNKVSLWTFTQGGAGASGVPSVGLVDEAMFSRNTYFASPYLCRWGKKCLGFWANGVTATSAAFTPPAGRWQIRFKSAFAGNQSGSHFWHATDLTAFPQWRVTVSVNGTVALTSTSAAYGHNKWATALFDGAFDVAEGDSVTVEIAQTAAVSAGYIDDVELVPANLVSNPGFETGTLGSWTGDASVIRYWWYPAVYGYDFFKGDYCAVIQGRQHAGQTLHIPELGRYRIRLHARTRPGSGANYAFGQLAINMVQGADTNNIARVKVDTDTFLPYTFWWDAPTAGNYTLVVRGEDDIARNTLVDEVSVVKCDGLAASVPDVPAKLAVEVASGAELALDFPGTLELDSLRLGGRSAGSGDISAVTHPDYIVGAGTIFVRPKATVLYMR